MSRPECVVFAVHLHLSMNRRKLRLFGKRIAADEFKSLCKKLSGSKLEVRADFGEDHRNEMFVADFKATSQTKKGIGQPLRRVFRVIQRFVDKSERLGCRKYEVYSVVMFAFPRSQRFLHLPHLPVRIESDPIVRQLGEWQLSSLEVTFRKSPLGLSSVNLAYRNGKQTLDIYASMKVKNTSKLPDRVYSKSESIATLFLV